MGWLLVTLCCHDEGSLPVPDGGRDACDEGHQLSGGADAHAQHPVRLVARRLQRPLQKLLGVVESACSTRDELSQHLSPLVKVLSVMVGRCHGNI